MMGAALTNLPFVRVIQELPRGVHWRGRAFADNLRLAALGDQRVAPNRAASRAVEGVARAVQDALAGAEDGKAPKLQAVGCAAYIEARFSIDVPRLIRARLLKVDPELGLSDEELAALIVAIRSLSSHHGACAVKTYLGGWATAGRLHLDQCGCIFGCHGELDEMRHYVLAVSCLAACSWCCSWSAWCSA